jgi:hypothetical protein
MRKWRLFFITLISFIAILGENWLKKIIPISLCILLNSNSAETNLYLQNALPQDFRISSQIPYSSRFAHFCES